MIDWTPRRIELLTRLWEAGHSASQIAGLMDTTRNSIIGKIDRLKLPERRKRCADPEQLKQRVKVSKEKRAIYQRIHRAKKRGKTIMIDIKPAPIPDYAGYIGIPFADLRPRMEKSPNECRYIAAEPAGPDYLACGNETLPGESWCPHCKGVVYGRSSTLTDDERQRRVFHMRKLARPATTAGDDVTEEAA
jgi:GcrA cell cycle regulator